MAWDNTMRSMLRILINDPDKTSYSDSRLDKLLVVAAHYVKYEINFDRDYTINVVSPNISPDPTDTATDDDLIFINFVVLKAACTADISTFRTKALLEGIRARCGPAWLEVNKHSGPFMELIDKGPCAAYASMKWEHELGNAQACKAVLSPFTGNNFDAQSLNETITQRRGFF